MIDNYQPRSPSQDPFELRDYIKILLDNDVKNVLNFGILHGASEWWIAEEYQKASKSCSITGIDINSNHYLEELLEHMPVKFPLIDFEFIQCKTSEVVDKVTRRYDAVFIDADHSYEFVKKDFEIARKYARKIIGFHDINTSVYDMEKFWNEIKTNYRRLEMIYSDYPQYGIGVIFLNGIKNLHGFTDPQDRSNKS